MTDAKRPKLDTGVDNEDPAVSRFREYLRINTMQPNPDYESAAAFLKRQAEEIGLSFQRWEAVKGKPCIILSLVGSKPELPSIVLNSHVDVVPVTEEKWIHPPFSANKEDGKIYARGSQDMKCVGMQYLEAIRKMKASGQHFKRTVHLTFVPDEEIGGHTGMELFVKSPEFKALNCGFALDEGLASEDDSFLVYYGERVPWWVRVKTTGPPGHGSRFVENTATVKLHRVIQKFLAFRDDQENALASDPSKALGDVTTVNLTLLKAGVQFNVIPDSAECGFDIRIPPTVDLKKFHEQIKEWTSEEGVTFEFQQVYWNNPTTPLDDSNVYWKTFCDACQAQSLKIKPSIFPAATDSRYIRCADIPAIGFSPMNNTPVLLHDHNEFLHEDVYMRGIDIYCEILGRLFSLE